LRKIIAAVAIITFFCVVSSSFAYERDERRGFQEIETLMLKEDYSQAKSKCDRFLRDYRQSRLRSRVYDLRSKAAKKIEGDASRDAYYIVQVGAFKKYRNAYKVKRSLKKQKFDAIIIKTKKNGKKLYKVRAGKFKNLNNAKSLLKRLKKKGHSAEIIDEE